MVLMLVQCNPIKNKVSFLKEEVVLSALEVKTILGVGVTLPSSIDHLQALMFEYDVIRVIDLDPRSHHRAIYGRVNPLHGHTIFFKLYNVCDS